MKKNASNKKNNYFKNWIIGGIVTLLIIVIFVIIGVIQNKNTFIERTIDNSFSWVCPSGVEYTSLDTDNDTKTTFGISNQYAISCSIEDGYKKAIEEYKSLDKASKSLVKQEDKYGLDGYLFTYYLLSYLGGVSKNVGIPSNEEIVELNNGTWLHYYNYPLKENGDKLETYITWNNGVFYYVEMVYKENLDSSLVDTIGNATLSNGHGFIPYDTQ